MEHPDYRTLQEEEMYLSDRVQTIEENNDPIDYPPEPVFEESNLEKAIRQNEERKARLEIIRKNEKETNEALKGKPIDYQKIHDNTEQTLHDNNY